MDCKIKRLTPVISPYTEIKIIVCLAHTKNKKDVGLILRCSSRRFRAARRFSLCHGEHSIPPPSVLLLMPLLDPDSHPSILGAVAILVSICATWCFNLHSCNPGLTSSRVKGNKNAGMAWFGGACSLHHGRWEISAYQHSWNTNTSIWFGWRYGKLNIVMDFERKKE